MLFRLIVCIALFSVTLLMGCGGDSSSGQAPVGIYEATYNRATGTLTIGIDANGKVDILIDDDTVGTFQGSGILSHDNTFSVNCAGPIPAIVTVTGTAAGSGAGRTVAGVVSGSFSVNYTANFSHDPSHTIFAGHYEGFFGGGRQGIWMGDVDSAGHFTGTWHVDSPMMDVPLTGTISTTGFSTFTATTPGFDTVTMKGGFHLTPDGVFALGTWSDAATNPRRGEWEGGNANEG